MKPLLEDFYSLVNQIQILFDKKEFEQMKAEIQLHANIIFSNLKKKDSIVLYITNSKQKMYRGFSPSAGLSLIGPSTVWKKILKGEKSLSTVFAEGVIKVPNLRVNWSKLWLLSYIITSVNNFN
jgi:hypothetical protein